MALHRRPQLRKLCYPRYVNIPAYPSVSAAPELTLIPLSLRRDKAFHLLLPRSLCHPPLQDAIERDSGRISRYDVMRRRPGSNRSSETNTGDTTECGEKRKRG